VEEQLYETNLLPELFFTCCNNQLPSAMRRVKCRHSKEMVPFIPGGDGNVWSYDNRIFQIYKKNLDGGVAQVEVVR
jgi:hypothetical protein